MPVSTLSYGRNSTLLISQHYVGKGIQDAMRGIEKGNPDTLFGIFGDAQWTNTERLPDKMLKDLIEHFSAITLSIANVPEDELGNAYEFLIKKFAPTTQTSASHSTSGQRPMDR